jgi:arabinogalactan oligomer/maltooligosaccharide transport system substrate-binding protein
MLHKKWYGILALAMIMSLLLAACAKPEEPTATPEPEPTKAEVQATPEPTKEETLKGAITLWHAWKESEVPALNKVLEAFQAENPDVQFNLLYVPHDDLRGKFETAAATGGGPTVLIGSADWGPAFYDAELVGDMSGMATTEFLRTINPAALGAVKYRGALIGLPQTIKGVVMFRNKSIISEAPATFDDLVATAQAATQGDVVGADLEYGFFFAAAHLHGVGGLLMNDSGDPLFNDEKGAEWLNLLNSFKDAGPTEYYTDNDVNLFKAGKAGIVIDGTWNTTGLAEAIGPGNLAIDPWPTPLSGYVQTENIYLGANAEGDDLTAGWKFIEFFLSPEAQATLTEAGHIPAVTGVDVTDPLMKQAAEAFVGGTAFPVIPEMGAYWEPMDTVLQSVFDEGADPAAALQHGYNSIVAAIADIRGEAPPKEEVKGTITLWHAWKESEIPALTKVIEVFQEKHPDVQFDMLYVPHDDLRGKFETAAATGGGPTVLIGSADWGPAFYDAELLADVYGFTTTPFLASINEAALGAVIYEGALIGLPQTIKGVVMFRNTSIIPEAPATFDDLLAAAQAATQGDVVGADLEYGFFFAAAHLNGIGGQLMDRSGDPLFNDEKGVEWLNLLNSFKDAGPTEYYTDNDVNLFKAGKAGIIIDGTWNMTGLAEAIGADNLAVDPWPSHEYGHLSGYVQTENIYLSANAEGDDLTAGWKFMAFFLSPEAQAILADVGHIPAVAGVEVADPLMLQAMDAFAGGAAFPVIPEMGAYWEPMDTALKSVFDEGADPAEVLQTAFDSITAAIEDIRGQ